ncbi:peptidylprolyl isomerase [Litorivivens sp.]|jgi:FKBP-type peptidyl-prolyl cis-trans isomerase SlyD|uniref:FKBP-type peptidyl-prolyl cis-trans isomerase n=1 Tax=Litorivivens sp. TaxID=2020868 RepID=UPI000C5E7245|nr:peptidylprolyl isomerase [Spongiibacteraceae bacterium]
MKIANNCAVSFHYTLTDEDGQTLDSSEGRDPLTYLHGHNGIIPGLENELAGKEAGESLKVVVQPADGYGEINPDLLQQVPREAFQGVESIEPGMQFQAQGEGGQAQMVVVREVSEEAVLVDGNHPLAGQVLNFDVTIDSVREASEEEIAHGHVH